MSPPPDPLDVWNRAEREPVYFSDRPIEWRFIKASWLQEPVVFEYWGGSTPGQVRSIVPRRMFRVSGCNALYFIGWCEHRQEDRTFRVDRAHPL